jgi:hypothetical protein
VAVERLRVAVPRRAQVPAAPQQARERVPAQEQALAQVRLPAAAQVPVQARVLRADLPETTHQPGFGRKQSVWSSRPPARPNIPKASDSSGKP